MMASKIWPQPPDMSFTSTWVALTRSFRESSREETLMDIFGGAVVLRNMVDCWENLLNLGGCREVR